MKKKSRAQKKVEKSQEQPAWGVEVTSTKRGCLVLTDGGLGLVKVVRKMAQGKGYHDQNELAFGASVSNAEIFAREQGLSEEDTEQAIAWVEKVEAMRGRGKELSATASTNRTSAMSKEGLIKAIRKSKLTATDWADVVTECMSKLHTEGQKLEQIAGVVKKYKRPVHDQSGGRPLGAEDLTPETPIVQATMELKSAGMPVPVIAEKLNRSENSIYRYLRVAKGNEAIQA